jgi:hypothetical protein
MVNSMAEDLKGQILGYMETHNTMTLGTCREDVPWAATVFYANDGFRLFFFSDPESRHCQNLTANPQVAVTIQEDYHAWRKIKGIQLEGKVAEIESLLEKGKAVAAYTSKFPEIIKIFTDPASGGLYRAFLKVKFYAVQAERVFYIDNEQGFGKRQELELSTES